MYMYKNILCKPLKFHGFTVQPNGAILVNGSEHGYTNGWVSVVNGGVYADDTAYFAVYLETKSGLELKGLDYYELVDLFGEQIAEKCYSQYLENCAM